ncbi:MAG: transcription elongation factor GreA [Candidatus Promineifilaceae bacterium]|nr:transcription elongation factor GreA [Candidatus Promineifilaceae bacterium]
MSQNLDVVYLTEEGLQKIKEELAYLTTVRREEISLKLQAAISQGDLKENADYHDAKEEQGFNEGRIRDLEDSLRRAQIIEDNGPSDVVRVGSMVTVSEEGYDEEEVYNIVGAHEADPGNGRISNESPIGNALLGARVGDIVTVETPGGEVRFEVQAIS